MFCICDYVLHILRITIEGLALLEIEIFFNSWYHFNSIQNFHFSIFQPLILLVILWFDLLNGVFNILVPQISWSIVITDFSRQIIEEKSTMWTKRYFSIYIIFYEFKWSFRLREKDSFSDPPTTLLSSHNFLNHQFNI